MKTAPPRVLTVGRAPGVAATRKRMPGRFLFLGRIEPAQGAGELLHACAAPLNDATRPVVCGLAGLYAPLLEERAQRYRRNTGKEA